MHLITTNLKTALKFLGAFILLIAALLVITPLLIPDTINREITKAINKNIKGQVHFERTGISFFSHFPTLTLDLDGFMLKGAAPFQQDTLVYARRLSLGLNLPSLLSDNIKVDKFYLDNSRINIQTDSLGRSNYNVFESSNEADTKTEGSGDTQIKIEGIFINNADLTYADQSIPFNMHARELNYTGVGNLSHAIFDLKSKLSAKGIDLSYDHTPYLIDKQLDAQLLTKVNTNSLELFFNENNLKISSLPIRFKGRFAFIKGGYDLNFKTSARETDLKSIFSAMPAIVTERIEGTEIDGYAEIYASLIGKYMAAEHRMPTLKFNMLVRDGLIKNPLTPEPISNLLINFKSEIPGLDPDSMKVSLDSLYFNIGKDYVSSVSRVTGLNKMKVYTSTRTNIDLQKWAQVIKLDSLRLKGRLKMDLKVDGGFERAVRRSGIRRVDTVISKVPVFNLHASLTGGGLRYPKLPAAVDKIQFMLDGHNKDGKFENTFFKVDSLDIRALNNFIKGYGTYQAGANAPVNVKLHSLVNLADLKNIYPIKGVDLRGIVSTDILSKGIYNKCKKSFPQTRALVKLDNGFIKTSHFDQALENIRIDAELTNSDGSLRSTRLNLRPISFAMGGQPFSLTANIRDLENVRYHVASNGALDLGKLYKMFAVKGYQVKGLIHADVDLSGLQSDAMNRRVHRLHNRGVIELKGMNLRSDLFPKEFFIKHGLFKFSQDKMSFQRFTASYGHSDFELNGNLANVVNFVLNDTASLGGVFTMKSRMVNANEFMVFNESSVNSNKPAASNGVIVIPSNFNMRFSASIAKVLYNGMIVQDAKGTIGVDKGRLNVSETGFTLAGAKVLMDASYVNKGLRSGIFDFKLDAENFDIARAYKEVKLFREMASSASKVKGIVGLNYQLAGRVNAAMSPVLPSVTGGGTLTLKNVSLMGFKMMNAVSKETKREHLTNPALKDVVIKSSVKNNILTIERTKLRVAGFRPRFEGQVSLDGKLNLSGRLGLPPFGLFGIPLSITGTQDNPVVRLKRNKEGKLEETEDHEEKNN